MTQTSLRSTGTRIAAVRVTGGGLGHEVRATFVVWQREMLRFRQDWTRLVTQAIQPLLFLFVLGTGLSSLVSAGAPGVNFRAFLFPGVLGISVLFTAVFSGISIVWDREFGFLREMLVAPISVTSILLGKCLGGATIATLQGVVLLALAGVVDVPYDPVLMLQLLGMLFLTAFTVTALGLVLAARVKQIQTAMPIVQLAIAPMMFLSGSFFPLRNLPTWLTVATHLNPLTYAVQPMREVVFDHLSLSPAAARALDPAVRWGDFVVPVWLQVLLVAVLGAGLLGLAVIRFARTE
jgi:ABC-2 type transport system permease protein